MKNVLLFTLCLLFTIRTYATTSCISYDAARLVAENTIQRYLDEDSRYKQDNPTVSQIVKLMNSFKFDGTRYTSELPYAGGNLTWELAVKCDGKSYFDVEYTGSYDDGYNNGD